MDLELDSHYQTPETQLETLDWQSERVPICQIVQRSLCRMELVTVVLDMQESKHESRICRHSVCLRSWSECSCHSNI